MTLPLSVLDLVPVPANVASGDAIRNSVALARAAERLGYTRYWVAEHHNTPGLASSATDILISVLARETSRIRVGSGGVMLPNHSPLRVAESFRTLEALYPGRIDLGLGRAPGTDAVTAAALRRSADALGAEDFPQQIQALRAFAGEGGFHEGHPFRAVQATPMDAPLPPLWLLGSSTYGAQLAAHLGLPYAFAFHFSPDAAEPAMRAYRQGFRPSEHRETPYAILAVSVLCAETQERAEELAKVHDLLWLRIRRGERAPFPTVEEALAYPFGPEELEHAAASRRMLVWGTPDEVRSRLLELASRLGADELMVTSHIGDPAERVRSYELLAAAFELEGPTGAR